MRLKPAIFLVAVLAIGTAHTASAQENNGGQCPPGLVPGVRYTTGAVTVQGWERSLTQNDPNLARWNWSAMTSYTQSSYGKVPAGHYVNQTQKPQGGIYKKPVHINPETYAQKRITKPIQIAQRMTSATDLSGQVRFQKPQAQTMTPVVAKSYNIDYTNCSGQLRAGRGNDSSQNVYGRLITQ